MGSGPESDDEDYDIDNGWTMVALLL